MTEYTVTWTVQVDADSPREAAELARDMQRDPGTLATFFEVAEVTTVNLGEREPGVHAQHALALRPGVTGYPMDSHAGYGPERMRKIKVKVAMRGRNARTLTYQTAQDVKLDQVVEVPRWPGMPEGPPLRGEVVALESDREGPLVTIIGG